MTGPSVLVACVGNIFFGDDAFGVEVARRLAEIGLPDGARVVDFGIRGLDLAYALLDGDDAVILVDATSRGGLPGTLYLLELDAGAAGAEGGVLAGGHNLDPASVLRLAATLGEPTARIYLVGCEPTPIDESEDFGAELTPPVRAAVDEAVPLIVSLVARILHGERIEAGGFTTIFEEKETESCRD